MLIGDNWCLTPLPLVGCHYATALDAGMVCTVRVLNVVYS